MTRVEQLEETIVALTAEEYHELRAWFLERDWALWDERLSADAVEGRLDFLLEEATQGKRDGSLHLL
ncbi:MAG: hypothetical protein WDA75_14340 [Candidatus Latescibacterota bacterium]|jgi:hypothetical protein